MKLFYRNNGAISVFLVIILVPCMLVASIFVDISRVELAKAVAESSGDLALSTLMTNYDYDLSDSYGLMGSCQNVSEYYSTVSGYFDVALHSQELQEDDIKLFYQRVLQDITSRFQDETISDIIRIQNQTEGDVVGPVKDATMYNATILQEQVVEFMKYRGPVVILQEIIERIQNAKGIGELLENDENKNLVDKKSEFYEAEGDLLKAAFDVYWMTRDYSDAVGQNGENMSNAKLQQYAQDLNNYRTAYQDIHRYLVSNLMNTAGLKAYNRVTIDLEKYKSSYGKTSAEIYSRKVTPTPVPTPTPNPSASPTPTPTPAPSSSPTASPSPTPTPTPIYYIDGDRVTGLMNDLTTAKDQFVAAKNAFITPTESLMNTLPGGGDAEAHTIQWWVQMNQAVNAASGFNCTTDLLAKADALVKAYAKVLAIAECEPGNNMPANWESKRTALLNDVKSLHGKYLVAGITDSTDKYLNAVNKLESVSAGNIQYLKPENLYVTVDSQSKNLVDAISYVQQQLDARQKDVKKYIDFLDKLLNADESGMSPMDRLSDLAGNYSTKLNNWSNTANSSSTTMATDNREEIEKIKNPVKEYDPDETVQDENDSNEMAITINREAVTKMKTRLQNIRSQYKAIYNGIYGMKYGNAILLSILDTQDMQGKASTVVQNASIGLTNQQVKEYADSTFQQLFQPLEGDIATLHDLNDANYDVLMNPATGQKQTPDLYLYMHKKFQNTTKKAVEDKQKEQDEAKEKAKEKEKEKSKNRYKGGGKNITPSSESSGDAFAFAQSGMSALIGLVKNLIQGDFDNIRDNMYATTYIMNMFSYATFEYEGYYGLLTQEEQKKLTLSSASPNYYVTKYDTKKGDANTEKTWLSAREEDAYNKTLRNKLINKERNAAYLAEVEYILYGGTNEDSVKKAYGDIYFIRYALNLVSAFVNFWGVGTSTGKCINAIATAVATATAGVIPPPLTKVVLLPILTIFETCKDLDRLEAGFPVEIYKLADDWWISLPEKVGSVSDFMSQLSGSFDRTNPGEGIYYSDYLTLFVYLGLQGENATAKKMYLRMGDVIQANMRLETEKSDYSLKKTQVYFTLKARLRVDPLMLTLPIYKDYVENPNFKEDWCTFEVKTIRGY